MDSPLAHSPAIAGFVEHFATGFGAELIIEIGPAPAPDLATYCASLKVVRVDPGRVTGVADVISRAGVQATKCLVVCANVGSNLPDPPWLLDELRRLAVRGVSLVLCSSGLDLERFELLMAHSGIRPTFVGWTLNPGLGSGLRSPLAIVDRFTSPEIEAPPADFSVTAVMAAFNEEDVIGETIGHLLNDQISVHLIDNWSTDGTAEQIREFLDTGMVTYEQFPASGPADSFNWEGMLRRIAQVAATSGSDWVIHHDADEIRSSPWPGVGLRDALYRVDRSGFTAIDYTVIEFWPVGGKPVRNIERDLPYFEFGLRPGHFVQVKTWANRVGHANLAATGGHSVRFDGRSVYPLKFLLKHYPVRSQGHGEKKILAERKTRREAAELERGWHRHYDMFDSGASFVRDRGDLELFDEKAFSGKYLIERLTGLNLPRA